MASSAFKEDVTGRFRKLVDMLNKTGQARTNSEVAALMNQPVQIMAKLLSGDRIITLEQASALAKNAGISTDWLLTGKGQAFQSQSSEDAPKENLINRVTTAIFQGEIPKALGEDIIRELMEYRDNDASQKEQINALNTRIIKMLDVARKYSE